MVKKAKKRGVKPGTKRGKYKRTKTKIPKVLSDAMAKAMADVKASKGWQVVESEGKAFASYSPAPVLTLCGQLEDAILLLENRLSNAIAKINSLM